jgi:hypothetical protein
MTTAGDSLGRRLRMVSVAGLVIGALRLMSASSATAAPTPGGDGASLPGLDAARDALGQLAAGAREGLAGGTSAASEAVSGASSRLTGAAVEYLALSLQQATGALVDELAEFVGVTTQPRPADSSLLAAGGTYQTIASFSVVILVAFIVLGVIHGLASGDPSQAVFRLVRDVPLAVLAITAFPWLLQQLVFATDGLSAAILPPEATLRTLLRVQLLEGLNAQRLKNPMPALLITFLTYLTTLLIYLELIVRVIVLRLVEALAPLSFAPIVWPPARGAARRVFELTGALLLSEPVIFVAISEGLQLIDQHATGPLLSGGTWGKLLLGVAVLGVAAFSPWVLWRLIPMAEAAVAVQGVSRAPLRGGMSGVQSAYWLGAVGSRQRGGQRQASTASPSPTGSSGDGLGPARSLPAPKAAGGPSAGGGAAAGAAGGLLAGAAAAAHAGAARAQTSAERHSQPPADTAADGGTRADHASGAAPGWSRRRPPRPPAAP